MELQSHGITILFSAIQVLRKSDFYFLGEVKWDRTRFMLCGWLIYLNGRYSGSLLTLVRSFMENKPQALTYDVHLEDKVNDGLNAFMLVGEVSKAAPGLLCYHHMVVVIFFFSWGRGRGGNWLKVGLYRVCIDGGVRWACE